MSRFAKTSLMTKNKENEKQSASDLLIWLRHLLTSGSHPSLQGPVRSSCRLGIIVMRMAKKVRVCIYAVHPSTSARRGRVKRVKVGRVVVMMPRWLSLKLWRSQSYGYSPASSIDADVDLRSIGSLRAHPKPRVCTSANTTIVGK